MAIYIPKFKKVFLSGSFSELANDLDVIRTTLNEFGFDAIIKNGWIELNTGDLIKDCEVFIAIIGLDEGVIKTPEGDTLPIMELNYAIRHRIPVIIMIKNSESKSRFQRLQLYRDIMLNRLSEKIVKYNDIKDLREICQNIAINGLDHYSTILKPLKAFVCHSSKDRDLVVRIVERLQDENIEVFYDKDSIGPGMQLKETIRKAITSIGYMIVCLSKNAIESEWVKDEIVWALEHVSRLGLIENEEFIIPVKIHDFNLPRELDFLNDVRYADFSSDFETGMGELLKVLK